MLKAATPWLVTADAAPSLERCTDLLEYGALYYAELDVSAQRTALLDFYNGTGGGAWTEQLISRADHQRFRQLVLELENAGRGLANSSLTVASPFPSDLVADLFNLPTLSVNCELQQWLSFGQLLLKFEWGSNVSYCRWYGVVCCKTSVSLPPLFDCPSKSPTQRLSGVPAQHIADTC